MNRKAKIIATLSTLGLAIAMLVFSVYAATTVTFKVTTNVSFVATKHVKATITARDSGATATVLTADASLYPNKAKTGADQTIGVNSDGTDNGKIEDVEFNPAQLTATDKYYGYQITITNNDEQNDLPVYIKTNAQTGEGYKVTFTNATDSTIKYNVPYIITCIIQVTDLAGNTVIIDNNDLALNINLGEKQPTNEYLKYTFKNETVDHYSVAIDETALNDSFDGEIIIPAKYNDGTNNVQVVKNITALNGSSTDLAEVTSVTLPNTIETIEEYSFKNASIENIILPASVTSVGSSAFSGVSGDIYIDKTEAETQSWDANWTNGHTGNVYYKDEWLIIDGEPLVPTLDYLTFTLSDSGDYFIVEGDTNKIQSSESFDGKIVIPETYDGLPVTIIKNFAFRGCTSLTTVEIPNSVTTIGIAAFGSCTNLTTIEIPNSVTTIGDWAFSSCSNLTIIEIPEGVTTIESYTFSGCTGLNEIKIPNSVTTIGIAAFDSCTNLTAIEIPNSVTTIENAAFKNCTNLTTIEIPNSVTTIGDQVFNGCINLITIKIPNSVTTIGDRAFDYCDRLVEVINKSSLNITAGSSNYGKIGFNALVVHEGEESLLEIVEGVYYYTDASGDDNTNEKIYACGPTDKNCTSITIKEGTTHINDSAFDSCTNLTEIKIPNSVTTIGYSTFYHCENLTEIKIPNSVIRIQQKAFSTCRNLKTLVIPDSVRYIMSWAFDYCNNLTIYCNAPEKPAGWDSYWNSSNRPVYWAGQWHYDAEDNPTPN